MISLSLADLTTMAFWRNRLFLKAENYHNNGLSFDIRKNQRQDVMSTIKKSSLLTHIGRTTYNYYGNNTMLSPTKAFILISNFGQNQTSVVDRQEIFSLGIWYMRVINLN